MVGEAQNLGPLEYTSGLDTSYAQGWFADGAEAFSLIDLQKLAQDRPVRVAVRFPMELAICLQTEHGQVEARSVDVSSNGVLFSGKLLPQVNSLVEFTMTMPGAIMGHPEDLQVHCRGRIVRHETGIEFELAAAVIDEYVLKA